MDHRYTTDIREKLKELKAIPNRMCGDYGDMVYTALCEHIEPLVADIEDELQWLDETIDRMEDKTMT